MTLSQFLDTFFGDIGSRLKNLGRIGHCWTSSTSGCQLYIEVRPSVRRSSTNCIIIFSFSFKYDISTDRYINLN